MASRRRIAKPGGKYSGLNPASGARANLQKTEAGALRNSHFHTATPYCQRSRMTSQSNFHALRNSGPQALRKALPGERTEKDRNRITTKQVTVDSSNTGQVATYFDMLYRVVQTRTNDPDGAYRVDTEYDGKGRVKKTSNPYRVSGGSAVWTETAYDALDRPVTVTASDSSTIRYSYTNNQTTTTDQAGNQRRYTYNILGQLTTVEEPNPSLFTPVTTNYKYYGFGPLYQSNQSSQTRTWVYNWLGQMTSQTLPESGTTSFTYDGAGRPSTKTDARSIVTTMTYDNANRLTQRSYSDSKRR